MEPSVYELLARNNELLAKQIEDGFARQDRRMSELLAGQQMTNGRVKDSEIKIAVHESQLSHGQKRIDLLADRTHALSQVTQVIPQMASELKDIATKVDKVPHLISEVDRIDKRISPAGLLKPQYSKVTTRDVWIAVGTLSAAYAVWQAAQALFPILRSVGS